jgi:mannosyl-oligosaccharide alpha-1,2-mannosidase
MGKGELFTTGWKRKLRGPDGKILPKPAKTEQTKVVEYVKVEEVNSAKGA